MNYILTIKTPGSTFYIHCSDGYYEKPYAKLTTNLYKCWNFESMAQLSNNRYDYDLVKSLVLAYDVKDIKLSIKVDNSHTDSVDYKQILNALDLTYRKAMDFAAFIEQHDFMNSYELLPGMRTSESKTAGKHVNLNKFIANLITYDKLKHFYWLYLINVTLERFHTKIENYGYSTKDFVVTPDLISISINTPRFIHHHNNRVQHQVIFDLNSKIIIMSQTQIRTDNSSTGTIRNSYTYRSDDDIEPLMNELDNLLNNYLLTDVRKDFIK